MILETHRTTSRRIVLVLGLLGRILVSVYGFFGRFDRNLCDIYVFPLESLGYLWISNIAIHCCVSLLEGSFLIF